MPNKGTLPRAHPEANPSQNLLQQQYSQSYQLDPTMIENDPSSGFRKIEHREHKNDSESNIQIPNGTVLSVDDMNKITYSATIESTTTFESQSFRDLKSDSFLDFGDDSTVGQDETILIIEEEIDERKPSRKGICVALACSAILCILILFALHFGLYNSFQSKVAKNIHNNLDHSFDSSNDLDISNDEKMEKNDELSDEDEALLFIILSQYTNSSILRDKSTAQYRAFNDLAKSPTLGNDLAAQFRLVQRYSLLSLYHSTSASNWAVSFGWSTVSQDECYWYGVDTCRYLDNGELAVSNIDLSMNELVGSIPPEICLLNLVSNRLENLNLAQNLLTGSIPTCLGHIESLQTLILQENLLEGTIPNGLLSLPNINTIYLNDNQLSGEISMEVPISTSLSALDLRRNNLEGVVPPSLAKYDNLNFLGLSGNQKLKGAIDDSLCQAINVISADCMIVQCDCCECGI